MGTYYTNDATKAEVIAEIVAPQSDANGSITTRQYTVKGNHLWAITDYAPADKPPVTVISLYLLSYDESCNGYGYKPMDETAAPYYYDCPATYLKIVPDPKLGMSTQWRHAYAEHNAKTVTARSMKAGLVPGARVQLSQDYNSATFMIITSGKNITARRESDNRPFTLTPKTLIGAAIIETPVTQ